MKRFVMVAALVMITAACGATSDVGGLADSDGDDFEQVPGASDNAMATLMVGDETYVFEKNDSTRCELGGVLPVSAYFQQGEDQSSGDWFNFSQSNGGVTNLSAVVDGEALHDAGSGKADEIRADGFTYTGELSEEDGPVVISLDVTC